MAHILIADDDTELCQLLDEYLTQEGFTVTSAHSGASAADLVLAGEHDLMILDVMLPGLNGFDVLRKVRSQSQVPILMLTAKGEEVDRIVGLELGADDYLAKPCSPRELVARIRTIIRRANLAPPASTNGQVLTIGDVELAPATRDVIRNGDRIQLTAAEFDVLALLLGHAGELVTREQLCERCLGRKPVPFDRSIDMHVSNIRRKLGPAPDGGDRIKTLRGTGYQYVAINGH